MYRCVIVDDEDFAINGLKKYIAAMPEFEVSAAFTDPLVALKEISLANDIDLIFMDVDMPMISGLELAAEVRHKTKKLVFTTSHSRYGFEAFEVEADAYLLKPYSFAKFASTLARLFPHPPETVPATPGAEDFFFVKDTNDDLRIVKVRFADLVAVESQQNYILLHTLQKKLLTYMSLTEVGKILGTLGNFAQFQRSFIINKNHIESINGNMIRMTNGAQISVGEYYKKDYNAFLEKNMLKTRRKN